MNFDIIRNIIKFIINGTKEKNIIKGTIKNL